MRGYPLPNTWVDSAGVVHTIRNRPMPYFLGATLVCPAATPGNVFSDSAFDHNLDIPFEVLRMIPRITTLAANGAIQSDPGGARVVGDELYRWAKMKIEGKGRTRAWMKSMNLLSTLLKGFDSHVEFDAPYYLEKGAGLTVTVDNDLTAALAAGGIRFELTFHGNLIECD